jgi:hypothetical protein
MDGMARSCGADIPDAEGGPQAHAGILQNDGGSVKPRREVGAAGVNSESSGTCEKVDFTGSSSLTSLAFRALLATLLTA